MLGVMDHHNHQAAGPTAAGSAISVLVADDDASIRRLVAKRLESAGYVALQARNGQEAADMAREHRPGFVVSDWNMPKLDGLGFARSLVDTFGDAAPPVILLTAREFEVREEMLAGLSIKQVLCKPFSARKLVDAVEAILAEGAADGPSLREAA